MSIISIGSALKLKWLHQKWTKFLLSTNSYKITILKLFVTNFCTSFLFAQLLQIKHNELMWLFCMLWNILSVIRQIDKKEVSKKSHNRKQIIFLIFVFHTLDHVKKVQEEAYLQYHYIHSDLTAPLEILELWKSLALLWEHFKALGP